MPRKKKQPPQKWETQKGKTFSRIYSDMLYSEAYLDMSNNQRLMYIFMRDQYYGKHKPAQDYPNMGLTNECFYFNLAIIEKCKIYSTSSRRTIYNDIHAIEEHGFIDLIANGKSNKQKSIYQFSDRWVNWKKEKKNDTS